LDREKETRRVKQSRTANRESKTQDEKAKLDLRIGGLIVQGYSRVASFKALVVQRSTVGRFRNRIYCFQLRRNRPMVRFSPPAL
jgi:hypothetical protein